MQHMSHMLISAASDRTQSLSLLGYIRCAALEKHSTKRVQIARCLLDIIRLTFRIRMFLLRHALKLLKICTTRTHNIIVCYVGSYTHSRYQLTR